MSILKKLKLVMNRAHATANIVLGVSLVFVASPYSLEASSSWINRKAQGWAWYEDRERPLEEVKEEPKEKEVPPAPVVPTATERVAKIRKEVEEKLCLAVLEPTPTNIRNYMQEQKKWIDQSGKFSKAWSHELLNSPELDYTNESPVSQYGIEVHKEMQFEKQQQFLSKLSKEYGLFFFYKSDCKFSQAFARVVKILSEKYEWPVVAITLDQGILEAFPNSKQDHGISQTFNVKQTPALFLVHPQSQQAVPIAFGLLPVAQIEHNIMLQFNQTEGR